jgi:hypothetical protein
MKYEINGKKKEIKITPSGDDEKNLLKLIVAFADPKAVKYPVITATIWGWLAGKVISYIIIDMNHPNITKAFIQTILRLKK